MLATTQTTKTTTTRTTTTTLAATMRCNLNLNGAISPKTANTGDRGRIELDQASGKLAAELEIVCQPEAKSIGKVRGLE